jgi:hypothetical protein
MIEYYAQLRALLSQISGSLQGSREEIEGVNACIAKLQQLIFLQCESAYEG